MTTLKHSRLNLRLTNSDGELIRHAANRLGQSVTDFLTSSAVAHAHQVLADERDFELDEQTWDEFVARLDRPVQSSAQLAELFARPRRIVRD